MPRQYNIQQMKCLTWRCSGLNWMPWLLTLGWSRHCIAVASRRVNCMLTSLTLIVSIKSHPFPHSLIIHETTLSYVGEKQKVNKLHGLQINKWTPGGTRWAAVCFVVHSVLEAVPWWVTNKEQCVTWYKTTMAMAFQLPLRTSRDPITGVSTGFILSSLIRINLFVLRCPTHCVTPRYTALRVTHRELQLSCHLNTPKSHINRREAAGARRRGSILYTHFRKWGMHVIKEPDTPATVNTSQG